jgi:hypothetical protein
MISKNRMIFKFQTFQVVSKLLLNSNAYHLLFVCTKPVKIVFQNMLKMRINYSKRIPFRQVL